MKESGRRTGRLMTSAKRRSVLSDGLRSRRFRRDAEVAPRSGSETSR